jgi:hypothetical protein
MADMHPDIDVALLPVSSKVPFRNQKTQEETLFEVLHV